MGKEESTQKTVDKSQRVSLAVIRVQSVTATPVALCTHTPRYLLPCIPSTLSLSVPVAEQLSQIQGTVMWMLLVLRLWHDLQTCPHLWETSLFLWFYCFALVRLSGLHAHWYQQDFHEASCRFPHARTTLVMSQEWWCPKSYQVTSKLSNWRNLKNCPWAHKILLSCSLWLEKFLLFSSRGGKNRSFWRQLWHLGFILPL